MLAQPRIFEANIAGQEERILYALETVLVELRHWRRANIRIRAQMVADFQLSSYTQEQACDTFQRYQIFADALRAIGDQLEKEVEDTLDQYHDWAAD